MQSTCTESVSFGMQLLQKQKEEQFICHSVAGKAKRVPAQLLLVTLEES